MTVSQEGRPDIHYLTMPDITTDLSLPVLLSAYHSLRSWSEVSEEMSNATAV